MTSHPPIGVPRVYDDTDVLPVLLPGEVARPTTEPTITQAIREQLDRGEVIELRVTGWSVEPMPGFHGWYLRMRWRLWGHWFSHGKPKVSASVVEVSRD